MYNNTDIRIIDSKHLTECNVMAASLSAYNVKVAKTGMLGRGTPNPIVMHLQQRHVRQGDIQ